MRKPETIPVAGFEELRTYRSVHQSTTGKPSSFGGRLLTAMIHGGASTVGYLSLPRVA